MRVWNCASVPNLCPNQSMEVAPTLFQLLQSESNLHFCLFLSLVLAFGCSWHSAANPNHFYHLSYVWSEALTTIHKQLIFVHVKWNFSQLKVKIFKCIWENIIFGSLTINLSEVHLLLFLFKKIRWLSN